jgi:hypothetical protein
MLRLDSFPDKTLRRYSLKKLWGQIQPLLNKPESVQNQCLHRLTDRDLPLVEVLSDMLVDTPTDLQFFEHSSDQTEVIEHLALWKVSFANLDRFDFF